MFTIPYAFMYCVLLRPPLFCMLLALNCKHTSIFVLFQFPFFQMAPFRCWALPLKVSAEWSATDTANSCVLREWSWRHTKINTCICASFDDALLFLPFLLPGASLAMKIEFLCLIGEISLEGSCWIQTFSAGNERGGFLQSCVSKGGIFPGSYFAFA